MSSKYILALDQGTTSSRAILFDHAGCIVTVAQKEFKQWYPQPGWVEHEPEEIWASQFSVMAEVIARKGITTDQVAAIGITNQRETTIVWDRETGKPIARAIVWQDRRTAEYCDHLKATGHGATIQQKTGLIIDAYFSATKLKWILDNVAGAREKASRGKLAFGTVDSWLIWKLSGGKLHITDVSNASRTMLLNIHTCEWDEDLLKLFDIPASVLPEVRPSSKTYGVTEAIVKHANIPIAGIAGDQQAALFGQMCTQPGMVKNTYGTGCFMLMNTGSKAVTSTNNLLTTVAWKIHNKVEYALEGSIFIAGAVVQWLRDGLHIIRNSADVEALAASVPDTNGVFMVPAFAGLGAPHWNQHARGSLFGVTRGTLDAHIARAALESIAYQTNDVLKAMVSDAGIDIKELRVDGGATINNALMQFQSDILQVPVLRPKIYETTALGAAYLAGLAVGYWDSVEELQKQWQVDAQFTPAMPKDQVQGLLKGWHRAVKASIAWADDK
ncbi:glycerol kinase GlpK [Paraflavitalea sp. CAU 1676]|uniref:glycerol kinase GlpK n=1 Tax=Paraflavitalea sp. CAU 1676 TaxID=3032598 RepID=UPI0023DA2D9F|nr:glycerol kinase GlpK [Paraflavitalea sp. CAU 1676]MDF2193151.1 glycerol kinase GlpK [Paraflavitalea sp. CAU 1676]